MIRAGDLDRTITIERSTETISDSGALISTFAPIATMRAQLVTISTTETLRNAGGVAEQATIFRTRWIDGVTTADQITYAGTSLPIKSILEIGRGVGLEFTCEALQ